VDELSRSSPNPAAARPSGEIVARLRSHVTFAAMAQPDLEALVAASPVDAFEAGETVFEQGSEGDDAYLVLEGRLEVLVETPLGQAAVATLGDGELVGEIGAFSRGTRTASIRALEASRLLRIERRSIRELMRRTPDAAMTIIGELGQRFRRANAAVATLTQATTALAKGEFDPAMLDALRTQADQFSHFAASFNEMAEELTTKRARNHELQTAAGIQRMFLPAPGDGAAGDPRVDLAAFMRPATEVGGDFYDHFSVGADRLVLAVGDVSGKGIPAAIFMSVARTVLRTVCREDLPAGAALTRLNEVLAEGNEEGMFVTVALGILDLRTGTMDYASGGHEEAYVVGPGGELDVLGAAGPAIGLFEGPVWKGRAVEVPPGAAVVFATDGVTEAFDPARAAFGPERLEGLLRTGDAAAPAAQAVTRITEAVDAFAAGAPQSDDITCLVARRLS
jgi:serine phosphatase RsbU (regulator of sigma subunit)